MLREISVHDKSHRKHYRLAGALTEAMSGHTELVYVYFWHDVRGTITGCYEGSAKLFDYVGKSSIILLKY